MKLNSASPLSVTRGQNRGASRKVLVFLIGLSFPLFLYNIWQIGLSIADSGSHVSGRSDFDLILCGPQSLFLRDQQPYQECAGNNPLSGFLYPPLSILFLAPLSTLPTAVAFVVLTILSVTLLGAVVAAIRTLAGDLCPKDRLGHWSLPLLIVSLAPVKETLVIGHINIVVLAIFVTGLFFACRHRSGTAGLIVSTGFWLKLYPATLAILFLARRELRPAALWSAIFWIALALLSLILIPLSLYIEYFSVFFPTMQKFTVPGHSQSIAAQLMHLRSGIGPRIATGDLNFVARPLPFSLNLLSKAVLVLGLSVAVTHMRRDLLGAGQQLEALSILLLTLLLYSPVAWSHHFVLAIPAMSILLMRLSTGASRVEYVLIATCWLALAVPGWTRFPLELLDVPGGFFAAGVFYMRYTLSTLCMIGLLVGPHLRDDFRLWRSIRQVPEVMPYKLAPDRDALRHGQSHNQHQASQPVAVAKPPVRSRGF